MFDFHYNFIKNNLDAKLLFTDTDSLTYKIKSEDLYQEFFFSPRCHIMPKWAHVP